MNWEEVGIGTRSGIVAEDGALSGRETRVGTEVLLQNIKLPDD